MAIAPIPVATERVQLTPTSGFASLIERLDVMATVGISHVYLSPVTEAVPGSTHGYDVVDHTTVREELGGMDGLVALLDALAARGMGALVDHVPNHASVARPELNPRWWQLLAEGAQSPAASWFDVDWEEGNGRVLLPVLGRPLDELRTAGAVRIDVERAELVIGGSQRFPLAAGTAGLPVEDAIAAQHYQLQWWGDPRRNVRRFFTIDDLVAVRVEDPLVAHAVDTVPRRLLTHPGFAGVRVDHVDGLADPGAYLTGLRELLGDRWLLVEKILATGESLPIDWPVDGTTGYEHARTVEHTMLDPAGFEQLRARWVRTVGDDRPYPSWEADARREALEGGLRPDVERVARVAVRAGVAAEANVVADAVTALCQHLGRYRTYLPSDPAGAEALRHAYEAATTAEPNYRPVLDQLVLAIAADDELRTRWQQLTGPATAKGVEDRVFFRYFPLSTLNEVGGDPTPSLDRAVAVLHDLHDQTARGWPRTLLAETTHDTKRSGDVRARGLALAAHADRWDELVDAWTASGLPAPDPAAAWLALQTAVTAGPIDAERLDAFLVKSAREAAVSTSWTTPNERYEAALGELASIVAAWEPAMTLAAELAPHGRAASLAVLAVRLTAPGVADIYQGSERFQFLLTDPDNRIEPDHAAIAGTVARAADLDGPSAWTRSEGTDARAVVLRRILAARRAVGPLVGYQSLTVVGADATGVIGFLRRDAEDRPVLATLVSTTARLGAVGDAVAAIPGTWRSVLDDEAGPIADTIDVAAALTRFPAIVLAAAP